jgi:catechol 2,3-dioxygenase-like lactoylglutathione lyase family enzyme
MIESIAFTVYPVKDVTQSRKFYEETLGLEMTKNWSDQWVEYDVGDTTFAITVADDAHQAGARGASIAFEVADFAKATVLLKQRGARFETHDGSVCFSAVLRDPDGNEVIIHKRKAN